MKLTHLFAALPLAFAPLAFAETTQLQTNHSVFHFSAQVEKVVEKDLMFAEVSSRKAGQRLSELKNSVSANLNKVVEAAKKETGIQIATNGVSHYPEYNSKGKVTGWVAEGRVLLEGKNFRRLPMCWKTWVTTLRLITFNLPFRLKNKRNLKTS